MESNSKLAAVVDVMFEFADGREETGTIFVRVPRQISRGQWRCEFGRIPPDKYLSEAEAYPDGYAGGADPMQALNHGLSMLYSAIKWFLDHGGKIYKTEHNLGRTTKHEIVLENYFGTFYDRESSLGAESLIEVEMFYGLPTSESESNES